MSVNIEKGSELSLRDKIDAICDHRNDLNIIHMHDEKLSNKLVQISSKYFVDRFGGPIEIETAIDASLERIFNGYGLLEPETFFMDYEKNLIHDLYLIRKEIRESIENYFKE